jgi:uncharacterized membrane protein
VSTLRDNPLPTGIVLGFAIAVVDVGDVRTVALLALVSGVVLALYGEGWHRDAGRALAGTGVTAVVVSVLVEAGLRVLAEVGRLAA